MGSSRHPLHDVKKSLGSIIDDDRVCRIPIEAKLPNFIANLFAHVKDELYSRHIEGEVMVVLGPSAVRLGDCNQHPVPRRNKYVQRHISGKGTASSQEVPDLVSINPQLDLKGIIVPRPRMDRRFPEYAHCEVDHLGDVDTWVLDRCINLVLLFFSIGRSLLQNIEEKELPARARQLRNDPIFAIRVEEVIALSAQE